MFSFPGLKAFLAQIQLGIVSKSPESIQWPQA